MATVQEMRPFEQPEAVKETDGKLTHRQMLNSWQQLWTRPTSISSRFRAISRLYQRLAYHYEREINEVHMRIYCEGLLDLEDLAPIAFEKVIKTARFFPSVEEIRAAVASDRFLKVEEIWRSEWTPFLCAIKLHGRTWREHSRLDLTDPRRPKRIAIAPPELSDPMRQALKILAGTEDWRDAIAEIQKHPFFYGDEWPGPDSPRLTADRIEKRVRDLWEAAR
jgi:hypothetical protein